MTEFVELMLEVTPIDGASQIQRVSVSHSRGASFGPSKLFDLELGVFREPDVPRWQRAEARPAGRIELRGGEAVVTAYAMGCDVTLDGRPIGEFQTFDVGTTLRSDGWSARLVDIAKPPEEGRQYQVEIYGEPARGDQPLHFSFTRSEGEAVAFGRVQGNDVRIKKGNISKRHCRLVFVRGEAIIVDLKSTNGTYVSGRKVSKPRPFRVGDKLYLSDYAFSLKRPVFSEPTRLAPAGAHQGEGLDECWRKACEALGQGKAPIELSSIEDTQRLAPLTWLRDGSPHLEHVRAVHLRGNTLTPDMVARIRALPSIRHLNLFGANVDDQVLAELLEGDSLPNLTTLELGNNGVSARSADLLANSSRPLETLDLYNNRLGSEGARALLSGSLLPRLQSLNLCGNQLNTESLRPLTSRPLALTSLSLGYNHLDDSAAEIIAAMNTPLEQLNLRANLLSPAGATALANATWRDDIRYLGLEWNPLGDRGCAILLRTRWAKLRGMQLSDTELNLQGANSLASGPCPPQLARLNLSSNPLLPDGVLALINNPAFQNVELRLHQRWTRKEIREAIAGHPLAYGDC